MDPKDLSKIAPLIKDANAWNAFLAVLDHQEAKSLKRLEAICVAEELIRINAEVRLIHQLRKVRDNWLAIEKGMN